MVGNYTPLHASEGVCFSTSQTTVAFCYEEEHRQLGEWFHVVPYGLNGPESETGATGAEPVHTYKPPYIDLFQINRNNCLHHANNAVISPRQQNKRGFERYAKREIRQRPNTQG